MKKNIEKVFILIIFLLLMIISSNFNTQSAKLSQNRANAICREYYEEIFVCCYNGNSGCTNAVNNEHRGPFYFY